MKIRYRDKRLDLIEAGEYAETRLPIAVINACRRKIALIKDAPDERTLRNWKGFHYEKLQGKRSGERSIRINDQWRLVFKLDDQSVPTAIYDMIIEDYH